MGTEENHGVAQEPEKPGGEEKSENAEEATKEEVKEDASEKPAEQEKPKEPEPPKELEEDAPADKRAKVKADDVHVSPVDSTINTLTTADGNLLMALGDGGFQYLLAGARATVGVQSGR